MASMDTLELEDLPFYQHLVSNYSDLYTKAQSVCSIMVVPQHVPNQNFLTRDIFESHLFRPSPCYVRKHVSWNEKYEIEYDNNRIMRVIYKKEGVGERNVKILSKEDVHDSVRRRSYFIFIIEQPLVDIQTLNNTKAIPVKSPNNRTSIPQGSKFQISSASYETSFIFLDSLREIAPAFERLRTQLFLFNEKYVILPKHVEQAIGKLNDLRAEFLRDSYNLLHRNTEDRDIELASEIYITGNTYTKVWPIILKYTEDTDKSLVNKIMKKKLENNQLDDTLNKNQSALNDLRRLDDFKTAHEKAKCIRSALDSAIAAKQLTFLNVATGFAHFHSSSNTTVMAADETLSSFIEVITQLISTSEPNEYVRLFAHQYYIQHFRYLPLQQDVDYAFTTYRIALAYINST